MGIYTREFPGVRREVEKGVGGVTSVWPKLKGQNVVVDTATASVGTVAIVDIPSATPEYSRLDVSIPQGAALDYEEDLPMEVNWETEDGDTGREVIVFDVVRSPIGLLVSANAMRERRPSLGKVLTRLGVMRGEEADAALTPEQGAAIYSAQARVELQDRLRVAARGLAGGRPALILDRDRLLRAETHLAVALCYEAIAKDPANGTDEDSSQARQQREAYNKAWEDLGPMAVDDDQDGVTDAAKPSPTINLILTRRG